MQAKPSRAARVMLITLVGWVVIAPWPFGAAHPLAAKAIAVTALLASLAALALADGRPEAPRRLVPSLLGLWLLGALQLVPVPEALHRLLAGGSAAVWHPNPAVAAEVLGNGWHPISLDPASTARWLAFTTGLVALALLAAPALRERRHALRASVAVVGGAVVVAVYALVARLAFGDKLYGFLAVPTVAPFGPFVSKNHFAGYVEMAACLAVGLAAGLADEARHGNGRLGWLDSSRSGRVVFAWGAAAVLVLAVPVSLSRGGVVSLAAGLVAFAALRLGTRRPPARGPALALAAGALAVVAFGITLVLPEEATARVRTLASIQTDGSGSYRIGIWRDSLRLAASSPLVGSGFGAFEDAIPRFKTGAGDLRIEHAENDYLEGIAEGGVVGGLLLGLALLAFLAGALARLRAEPHRLARGLRCGALAGAAALLVHSAFDFNLRIPSNALLFALLAAFALTPASSEASGSPEEAPRLRRQTRIAFGVVLVIAAALAVATPWIHRRLDRSGFDRAARAARAGLRWQTLEDDTIAHLRRRPADATAWVGLAWLRQPTSPSDAAALADWGVALDPQYEALRASAERVIGARGTQQRDR